MAPSSCCAGGESKSPGVHIVVVLALDVGDEDVMPHVLAPFVPMAIQQPREAVHLDRILLGLVAHAFVARLVRTFGIDVGHERDARSVGRHDERWLHAHREIRDPFDAAAFGIGEIDLRARRRESR